MRRRSTLLLILLGSGCYGPWNLRTPELAPRGAEYDRRESQIQDPYPDKDLGPDIGFRPPEFQQQRSEVQRSKDRSYSSYLRSRFSPGAAPPATPGGPALPPSGMAPQYLRQ